MDWFNDDPMDEDSAEEIYRRFMPGVDYEDDTDLLIFLIDENATEDVVDDITAPLPLVLYDEDDREEMPVPVLNKSDYKSLVKLPIREAMGIVLERQNVNTRELDRLSSDIITRDFHAKMLGYNKNATSIEHTWPLLMYRIQPRPVSEDAVVAAAFGIYKQAKQLTSNSPVFSHDLHKHRVLLHWMIFSIGSLHIINDRFWHMPDSIEKRYSYEQLALVQSMDAYFHTFDAMTFSSKRTDELFYRVYSNVLMVPFLNEQRIFKLSGSHGVSILVGTHQLYPNIPQLVFKKTGSSHQLYTKWTNVINTMNGLAMNTSSHEMVNLFKQLLYVVLTEVDSHVRVYYTAPKDFLPLLEPSKKFNRKSPVVASHIIGGLHYGTWFKVVTEQAISKELLLPFVFFDRLFLDTILSWRVK